MQRVQDNFLGQGAVNTWTNLGPQEGLAWSHPPPTHQTCSLVCIQDTPIHIFFCRYTIFLHIFLRMHTETKIHKTHIHTDKSRCARHTLLKKKHLATHPALHSPKVCHQKGVKGQDSGQQFTGGAPRRRLERADPNADPRPVG